jgi:hypothetical protein
LTGFCLVWQFRFLGHYAVSVVTAGNESARVAAVPSAGRGEIRLALLGIEGESAGRDKFERLVTDIVKVIHPAARSVEANPGDWGIDTLVGELDSGRVAVWQSKYFVSGIGDSQKQQIRESFASVQQAAAKHSFALISWTLVIPTTFDAPATKWWDKWVKEKKTTGIAIKLWAEADLRSQLMKPDFEHVRNQYFGTVEVSVPVERSVDDVADPTTYDSALFIKQLRAANIFHDNTARRAFFNAEVMTRDVHEREVDAELADLKRVRFEIEQRWHTRFEGAKAVSIRDDGQLPSLYPDVCSAIESYHEKNPSQHLRDSLVHRTGLVHHLVEEGKVGWVSGFELIASSHGK